MTRLAVLGCIAFVACTACGSGSGTAAHSSTSTSPRAASTTAATVSLQPQLVIKRGPVDSPNWVAGHGGCRGANGYDDLKIGAGVTLYAANGDVAGTGFITDAFSQGGTKCIMTATVDDVKPAPFFKVQFANRNEVAFSLADLENQTAYLTIG